jgi:hypothetical protein
LAGFDERHWHPRLATGALATQSGGTEGDPRHLIEFSAPVTDLPAIAVGLSPDKLAVFYAESGLSRFPKSRGMLMCATRKVLNA